MTCLMYHTRLSYLYSGSGSPRESRRAWNVSRTYGSQVHVCHPFRSRTSQLAHILSLLLSLSFSLSLSLSLSSLSLSSFSLSLSPPHPLPPTPPPPSLSLSRARSLSCPSCITTLQAREANENDQDTSVIRGSSSEEYDTRVI
jgi:hypothetical protein